MIKRTYIILDASKISTIDYSKVCESSSGTLKYCRDRSKVILKYEGSQPSFLTGETEYTHAEISAIVNDENGDWYVSE